MIQRVASTSEEVRQEVIKCLLCTSEEMHVSRGLWQSKGGKRRQLTSLKAALASSGVGWDD